MLNIETKRCEIYTWVSFQQIEKKNSKLFWPQHFVKWPRLKYNTTSEFWTIFDLELELDLYGLSVNVYT